MAMVKPIQSLRGDSEGAMVIETAFVLPILVLLGLGGFEASQMVARNTELQTALAEATAVALAVTPDTQGDVDTIEDIVEASTGLGEDKVKFTKKYRCASDVDLVTEETSCSVGTLVSEFIEIDVSDTYTPIWTEFGIGKDVNFQKVQLVQIGQFEVEP